jgi:CYTH domain-containing protein
MLQKSEIEKKYLLKKHPLGMESCDKATITQTYIYLDAVVEVRIRDVEYNGEHKYYHTIKVDRFKSPTVRGEIESEIDKEEYDRLLIAKVNGTSSIRKTRYYYPLPNSLTAEIDIYEDENEGLETVEVEFDSFQSVDNFDAYDWFGSEVTNIIEYKNRSLAQTNESEIIRVFNKKGEY